jgi:hypothetical protein
MNINVRLLLSVVLFTSSMANPALCAQEQPALQPRSSSAEDATARTDEQPLWIAKSTREMTAIRDGKSPGPHCNA